MSFMPLLLYSVMNHEQKIKSQAEFRLISTAMPSSSSSSEWVRGLKTVLLVSLKAKNLKACETSRSGLSDVGVGLTMVRL